MIKAINHNELSARGALLCGNDDFVIVQCISCRNQYLYNQEDLKLYIDPDDLSDFVLNVESGTDLTCSACGKSNWDFEELEVYDLGKAKNGPWAWAL